MKNLLVIDRFTTTCGNCGATIASRKAKSCGRCRQTFKYVSTHFTCGWMKDAAREFRKDLIFIEPVDAFKPDELVL